jgi:phosphinothricin acetyltransferase
VPSWERWEARHLPEHRFVAVRREALVGWAAVSPVSEREVYRGVVESSVYVGDGERGEGVGRLLLERLVASTAAGGIWRIQAAVFPENAASLALHRGAGFDAVV